MLLWMLVWGLFWCHLGVHLGSTWGQLGVHLGSQERLQLKTPFQHLFDSISNPSWTPSWPNLEALGRLGAVLGPCISHHLSNALSNLIFNRFEIPKRPPNQSKIDQNSMPKSRSEKDLISVALRLKFKEHLMLMPKEPIFKNQQNHDVFACCLSIRLYQ